MAIAHRTSATATASANTSVTCTKPTGTVDNDVMVAQIATTNGPLTVTPPLGWNPVTGGSKQHSSAPNFETRLYYKVASSEGANYQFTLSAASDVSLGISSYSGVDTSTPIDVSASSNDGNSTAPSATSINTATNNAQLIWCTSANTGSQAITEPSGFAERYETGTVRNEMSDVVQTTAGSTGAKTGTLNSARDWITFMFALKPAGAAAAASVPMRRRPYRFFFRRY